MKLDLAIEARSQAETLRPFKIFLAKVLGRKIYIGHEQREGFSTPIPFYLFWCHDCKHWAKDYPHGYPKRRHLYCSYCNIKHDFIPWWIYYVECWQTQKILWKYFWGYFRDELIKRFRRLGELFLVVIIFLFYFSLTIGLYIHGKITKTEHMLD